MAKQTTRLQICLAVPILAVAAFGVFFLWWKASVPGDAYAFSDVHWDFVDRRQPWDDATRTEYTDRCLEIARKYPGSFGALGAVQQAIDKGDSLRCLPLFQMSVERMPLASLGLGLGTMRPIPEFRPSCRTILDRLKAEPNTDEAPALLAWVCKHARAGAGLPPFPEFREAATILIATYPNDKRTAAAAEVLGERPNGDVPHWVGDYEAELRTMRTSTSPFVRTRSTVVLGLLLLQRGDANPEAFALLEPLGNSGETPGFFDVNLIEFDVRRAIRELTSGALSMLAPSTDGTDLDGKPLSLNDHRGKVVMVVFWSSSCGPCLAMAPHERELAKRYAGKPFVIVGINCDNDPMKAKNTATKLGMTWPSFADRLQADGERFVLAERWNARGLPLVCVVDPAGIVRFRKNELVLPGELDPVLEKLVAAAEAK